MTTIKKRLAIASLFSSMQSDVQNLNSVFCTPSP